MEEKNGAVDDVKRGDFKEGCFCAVLRAYCRKVSLSLFMTQTNVNVSVSTFYPANWVAQESSGGSDRDRYVVRDKGRSARKFYLKATVGYCSFTHSQTRSTVEAAAVAVTHSSWKQLKYLKTLSVSLAQFVATIVLLV